MLRVPRDVRQNVIHAVLALLLISSYLVGNVRSSVLHLVGHAHEVEHHTAENEADACHRAIYHGEPDQHEQHLTKHEVCALCDLVLKNDHNCVCHAPSSSRPACTHYLQPRIDAAVATHVNLTSSRAPPTA